MKDNAFKKVSDEYQKDVEEITERLSKWKPCCLKCMVCLGGVFGDIPIGACTNSQCDCHKEIEVRQKNLNDQGCHTANGILVCFCGQCKQEDYQLPSDFPKPPDPQTDTKSQDSLHVKDESILDSPDNINTPMDSKCPKCGKDNDFVACQCKPPDPQAWEESFQTHFLVNFQGDDLQFTVQKLIDFIRSLLAQDRQKLKERVEGMKKNLPKDPLDMTFRESMNRVVQPVYRPYVSNEESFNSALDEVIKLLNQPHE